MVGGLIMTTGEKLQNLRKKSNYTQEELADVMNVSRQAISKWESDVAFPETEKLIALSKLYKCSIDYLLNNENDNPNIAITKEVRVVNRPYNKRRLPLIISSLSTYFLLFFIYSFPWLVSERPSINGRGEIIDVNESFYSLTLLRYDLFTNAMALKYLCIGTIVFMAFQITICYLYIVFDFKGFKIAARISNIILFVLMSLFVCLTFTLRGYNLINWMAPFYIAFALTLILVAIQYAIPQIRKTR